MRSPLCAESYTLRAIFGPWNPIGANRHSQGLDLRTQPLLSSYSPECVEGEFWELRPGQSCKKFTSGRMTILESTSLNAKFSSA